jgi:hypothetical protein
MSRKIDKKVILSTKKPGKKGKKGNIQKYVHYAIAMYMSFSYWHFVEIVDYWLNISR